MNFIEYTYYFMEAINLPESGNEQLKMRLWQYE